MCNSSIDIINIGILTLCTDCGIAQLHSQLPVFDGRMWPVTGSLSLILL